MNIRGANKISPPGCHDRNAREAQIPEKRYFFLDKSSKETNNNSSTNNFGSPSKDSSMKKIKLIKVRTEAAARRLLLKILIRVL